jgi:hypothetical protein
LSSVFEDGGSLPTVSASELLRMQDILDKDIPRLRRLANATEVGIAKPPSEII